MPTYHYRCSQCDQGLEVVQKMTDEPITECAVCGGEMQKVLKPIGIVLKGSGFYRTDSRGSGPKGATAPKSSDSSSSSGSESKSASPDSSSGSSSSGSSSSGSSSSGSSSSGTKSEAKSATA